MRIDNRVRILNGRAMGILILVLELFGLHRPRPTRRPGPISLASQPATEPFSRPLPAALPPSWNQRTALYELEPRYTLGQIHGFDVRRALAGVRR